MFGVSEGEGSGDGPLSPGCWVSREELTASKNFKESWRLGRGDWRSPWRGGAGTRPFLEKVTFKKLQ